MVVAWVVVLVSFAFFLERTYDKPYSERYAGRSPTTLSSYLY